MVNADADHAECFIAAAKARGPEADHRGPQGRNHSSGPARRPGRRPGADPALHDGKIFYVELPQAGEFQASNALVAAGLAIGLGEDAAKVFAALEHLKGAPGRMEKVAFAKSKGAPIYVDYAHTPTAWKKSWRHCGRIPPAKLHVVFGCGGDRDKGKRPADGRRCRQAGR